MGREFVLTSVEDGSTLRMSSPDQSWGSITVEAQGNGFKISAPVYVDMAPSIPAFLDELAAPPDAKRDPALWETLEGELRIEASRDSTGHTPGAFPGFHTASIEPAQDRSVPSVSVRVRVR